MTTIGSLQIFERECLKWSNKANYLSRNSRYSLIHGIRDL